MTIRACCVLLHRYAGLTTAIFLAIAGLTGSIIAFQHELDAWLNPELFSTASRGEILPPSMLAARIEQADPRLRVTSAPLRVAPGESARLRIEPRINPTTGQPFTLEYDELFADPITGAMLGTRLWGACCFERQHIIPFLYRLHYTLHVPGNWGVWLMGIVALIWTIDCCVGAYLTFPHGRPFFTKWKPAWRVKTDAGRYRLNFDLHRASGLWFWGMLLALAVSGVSLNLRDEVFRPVVSLFSLLTTDVFAQREEQARENGAESVLSFKDAAALAQEEAKKRGWRVQPGGVFYSQRHGIYGVDFKSTQYDLSAGLGAAVLYFDGADGRLLGEDVPGEGAAGDIFLQLQFPLHSGRIAGLPGRIFICMTGLVVAILSITGVVIWLKKRTARHRAAARRIAVAPNPVISPPGRDEPAGRRPSAMTLALTSKSISRVAASRNK